MSSRLYGFWLPSVLWRCWLGGRKRIRPVKKSEWWGAGVVICLERGADLHMAQLMPLPLTISCFSKIQIGFTFLVPAHPGSPGKRAVKRVCVCVCVCHTRDVPSACWSSAVTALLVWPLWTWHCCAPWPLRPVINCLAIALLAALLTWCVLLLVCEETRSTASCALKWQRMRQQTALARAGNCMLCVPAASCLHERSALWCTASSSSSSSFYLPNNTTVLCLQCFDAVGWAAGSASGL